MKRKGNVSQVYIERDNHVLPKLIKKAKSLATYPTTMNKLYYIAAELPTDKFYITDDAAYAYIYKRYLHNIVPKFTNPYKHQLFEAFYNEVCQMMQCEKYKLMGLRSTTILALGRPAPCCGLTPLAIRNRISKIRCRKRHE